jgi:hypothetical protein
MCFNQGKKILRLMEDRIRSNYEIRVTSEAGHFSRTVRLDIKNMPNILIGTLKRAKSNRNA